MDNADRIGDSLIYRQLDKLGVEYDYVEHEAAPTADVAALYWADMDGLACKNLFFRNHKGKKHYLVILPHDVEFKLRPLELFLNEGKLSFASGWRLESYLGTTAGAISPLGLVFDREHNVHVYIHEALRDEQKLIFHPNDNRAGIEISLDDLLRYIENCGNSYDFIGSSAKFG